LLEKDRWALGRTKEEHGVDLGEVESFVEEVGGEECIDAAVLQVTEGLLALRGWRQTWDSPCWNACCSEDLGHVVGVGDRDAESERPHGVDVRQFVLDFAQDDRRTVVVAGVQLLELAFVVPTASPLQIRQVRAVCDPEVLERAEKIGWQGFPEAQLDCGSTAEIAQQVEAVSAFWRRRQT
jgi:hypothetical protein